MARDYLTIGSSPPDEDCVQVGSANYSAESRLECARYIGAIRRFCGPEQGTARLSIKSFPHDFGSYTEVVCYYEESDPIGFAYALHVEGGGPATWDCGLNGNPFAPPAADEGEIV